MRPHGLRTKITWSVVGVTLFLLVSVFAGLWMVLAPIYRAADRDLIEKDRSRAELFFRLRWENAVGVARDWAVWNDMASWVEHGGASFAENNLRPENLVSMGYRSLSIHDAGGKELLTISRGAGPVDLGPTREAMERAWRLGRDTATSTRWVLEPGRIWLLVGQPVRGTTYRGGRPVGFLFGVVLVDSAGLFSGVEGAVDSASPRHADTAVVRANLPSPGPGPAQSFWFQLPRTTWIEGRNTLFLLAAGMLVFAALFGAFAVWLFERVLLRRLDQLHEDLEETGSLPVGIGVGRTSGARPHFTRIRDLGSDELGELGDRLNATFRALEESRRHLADAQRIARLGFLRIDLGAWRAHVSAEHVETAGLDAPPGELEIGFEEYLTRFVHPEDRERLRHWAESFPSRGEPEEVFRGLEYRVVGRDNEIRHLSAASRRGRDAEGVLFLVVQDVSERRRMEEEILRGSLYDPLTGLPNRNLVLDRVRSIVDHAAHPHCALLVLALDRFQAIHSSLGREVGEGLLLGVSVRLASALPPGTTVGRMSHESFGVLLETDDIAEITSLGEHLRQVVRTPLPLGERELVLTASVGVARARHGECSADELMSRAESAQYQAAGRGGDCTAFFDEERSRSAREKVDLEMELANAIPDQLELHYQPIVHLQDGRVAGFEALVRWRHPTRGLVSPVLFIPIAERSGMIHPMGQWVMEEAMRVEAAWQATFGETAPFMSINLSVRQFLNEDLSDQIRSSLDKTGVDPRGIKLEITESALSEDPAHVAQLLESLVSKGVSFSLDDFGTGYSSLGYLSSFPVHTLKVDKSFVDLLGEDGKKTRITSAIVNLAHTLGMEVVAEGIEHAAQWDRLRALKCEYGQGYLFSRPLPLAQAREYLEASRKKN